MRMRSVFLASLLFLSGFLCLAGSGLSADTFIIDANATPGGKVYNSLEQLRQAINNGTANPGPNDIIELRNDDETLTEPLTLRTGQPVTITSAYGKRYSVGNGLGRNGTPTPSAPGESNGIFSIISSNPQARFENISIVDGVDFGYKFDSGIYSKNTSFSNTGTLTLANSTIQAYNGIELDGRHDVTTTNTIINGEVSSIFGAGTNLTVNFDANADLYNHWTGVLAIGGSATFNIAGGKYFMLDDSTIASSIIKNGQGTLKLDSRIETNHIAINEGTLQFMPWSTTYSSSGISIAKDAVLKLSIEAGDIEERWEDWDSTKKLWTGSYSVLVLGDWYKDPDALDPNDPDTPYVFIGESIKAEKGARLEIGGISTMPAFSENHEWTKLYAIIARTDNVILPESLKIDNVLLTASLEKADVYNTVYTEEQREIIGEYYDIPEDGTTGYVLKIDKINNLAVLNGVGHYADIYRKSELLTELERDLLDSIYARGGTEASDLGFLQTLGGHQVQNSLLGMRHNQADLITRINRRLTAYQKEELEANPFTGANSDDPDYYNDCEEIVEYGQMWASLDQGWHSQRDVSNLPGYRMSNTTLTIGYDKHIDEWIYGGALSYSSTDMKLKNLSSSRTDVKNVIAAVYASWAREGWYVSGTGTAGYGWNDARGVYALPGTTLTSRTGNFATNTLGINFETGHMMETDLYGLPVRFTPYGGLTYSRLHRQAVSEMGADNGTINLQKKYSSGNWNIWEAAIGARVATPIQKDTYVMVPSVDLAWTRTTGTNGHKVGRAYMDRDPAVSWYIPLMSENRSSYRMIAGLDVHTITGMTLSANYELEHRKDYWKNQFNVTLAKEF